MQTHIERLIGHWRSQSAQFGFFKKQRPLFRGASQGGAGTAVTQEGVLSAGLGCRTQAIKMVNRVAPVRHRCQTSDLLDFNIETEKCTVLKNGGRCQG
jgi:hypothetical protein